MKKTIRSALTSSAAFLATFLAACLFLIVTTHAAPAYPDPVPFTQPNGSVIQVIQRGDEFLTWSEDTNGHLILFDKARNGYCYANWTENGPVSTGELLGASVLYGRSLPKRERGIDIPQTVLENAAQQRAETRPVFGESLVSAAPANRSGAPVVNSIEELRRNLLIIYVRWEDESNITYSDTNEKIPPLTGKQIYERVFDPTTRSMNDYYKEMLGFQGEDELILPAAVTEPLDGYSGIVEVTLPGQHTNPGGDSAKRREVLRSAVGAADQYINFARYNTNGNGYLEAAELSIGVIVHGYEATAAGMSSETPIFWGISSFSFGSFDILDGVRITDIFGVGAF
ncbi:MAG: hypothetical protein LBH86_00310, partial [Oscillospiraceae bacterium]|nr:hypothetical protein [Oscillospiraceae bacterium]